MPRIVWLASYPKSGNTWFRTFLTNFLRDAPQPASINDLDGGHIASARAPFDAAVGYDSGELTPDEVDALRPEVYLHLAHKAKDTLYCKCHDAYTFLPDGRPLLPPAATQAALYFIRNPLDVAVSYAAHGGSTDYERAVKLLGKPDACVAVSDATEPNQLRQRLLSWSRHVTSWATAPGIPVQVIRFEDMKLTPKATFTAAVRFLGLPADPARISKAIQFSRFEELQQQERASGFQERLPKATAFFRKGTTGSWREALTPEQAARVIADHADVMRQYGYLDAAGQPVY